MAAHIGVAGEVGLLPQGCSSIGETAGARHEILVCGGAVVDCIVRPFDAAQRGASRTSLPGEARVSLGGVGRNIAEVIARLGGRPHLLSVVGDDDPGRQVVEGCRAVGVGVDTMLRSRHGRTATYTALLDGSGELVGAVADMSVFDELQAHALQGAAAGLGRAGLVVCDANIQGAALEQMLALSAEAAVPAWFEPVSVAKAPRGRAARPWHLVAPNWDELLALLGRPGRRAGGAEGGPGWRPPAELLGALDEALERRLAEHVLVSLGPGGALLASAAGAAPAPAPPAAAARELELDAARLIGDLAGVPAGVPPLRLRVERLGAGRLWYRLLAPLASVRDVTGAGDALLAGAARAFSGGWPLEEAVVAGLFCAHVTLFASGAVPAFLSAELFRRLTTAVAGASRL